MPKRDEVPSTRLARSAMLGGYVAGQSAKYAGTAAGNIRKPRAERKLAIERRHLEAAEQLLAVLGTLKGPAMKIGQVLSFMDLGLLPDDVRPRFQKRLAALCEEAPPVSWARMEPVLVKVLGGPIADYFSEFDTEPIGSASIGQVYRATTRDGRAVAVKVQYPDIAAAAKADLRNLSMMLRLSKSLASSVDLQALAKELTERLLEELDYEQEARSTARVAEAYAGHPFITVPAPVLELCRPELVVTEYVDGLDFNDVAGQDTATRDRVGEVVARFYLGSLFRLGFFSGDPHPGNIKLLPDGRLAFLDFGSFKALDTGQQSFVHDVLRGAVTGRTAALVQTLVDEGVLARPEGITPESLGNFLDDTCAWFVDDGPLTMTPRVASEAIIASVSPASAHQQTLRDQDLPVDWTLVVRTLITTSALLGKLEATANWHRIAREWVTDDGPSTELGELEAEFFKE